LLRLDSTRGCCGASDTTSAAASSISCCSSRASTLLACMRRRLLAQLQHVRHLCSIEASGLQELLAHEQLLR
jgi:hypothetical protein